MSKDLEEGSNLFEELGKTREGVELTDNIEEQEMSGDGVFCGSFSLQQENKRFRLSGELDEITQAYVDEVPTKYFNQIATSALWATVHDFSDLTSEQEYIAFFKKQENKQLFNEVKANQKHQLEEIVAKGYATVDYKFGNKFNSIDWQSEGQNTKKTTLRDQAGNEIAKLTETTHKFTDPDSFPEIKKQDGSGIVKIKNYRTIDIPKKINPTLDNDYTILRWSLRDPDGKDLGTQNGQPCLIVRYNKEGELTHIFPEESIKFNGEDNDSIGYIEHGGKIYTLAVNYGTYQALLKEKERVQKRGVEASQEMGLSVDKTVDSIVVGKEDKDLELPGKSSPKYNLLEDFAGARNMNNKTIVEDQPLLEIIELYHAMLKRKIDGSGVVINSINNLELEEEKKSKILAGIMQKLSSEERGVFVEGIKKSPIASVIKENIAKEFCKLLPATEWEQALSKLQVEENLQKNDKLEQAKKGTDQVTAIQEIGETFRGKDKEWSNPLLFKEEQKEPEAKYVKEVINHLREVVEKSANSVDLEFNINEVLNDLTEKNKDSKILQHKINDLNIQALEWIAAEQGETSDKMPVKGQLVIRNAIKAIQNHKPESKNFIEGFRSQSVLSSSTTPPPTTPGSSQRKNSWVGR